MAGLSSRTEDLLAPLLIDLSCHKVTLISLDSMQDHGEADEYAGSLSTRIGYLPAMNFML